VAVASARPYADHLHLAPDRQSRQHLITRFFTGWMLFVMPSQQRQITEGNIPSYYSVMVYDDANDRRFAKRIMQNASTALRVPVRCEEISLQR